MANDAIMPILRDVYTKTVEFGWLALTGCLDLRYGVSPVRRSVMSRVLIALALLPLLAVAAPVPKSLKNRPPVSLDGTWEVVEINYDGKRSSEGTRFWTIDGSSVLLWNRDWVCVGGFEWKSLSGGFGDFDRTVIGAQFGQVVERTDIYPGVHEASGDILVVCTASVAGGDRPTDCTTGKGRARYELKRVEGMPKK